MDGANGMLSESQVRTLVGLQRATASISVLGSLLILMMIFQRCRRKELTPYYRLMTGLSLCDLSANCAALWGISAVPANLSIPGALGSTTTCEIQGFVAHTAVIARSLYNSSILVLLAMVINNGLRNKRYIGERFEKFCHFFCLSIPITTTLVALCLDLINPLFGGTFGCAISDFPPSCSSAETPYECTRGRDPYYFVLMFTLLPLILSSTINYASIATIYFTAWKKEQQKSRFAFGGEQQESMPCQRDSVFYGSRQSNDNNSGIFQTLKEQAVLYALAFFKTDVYVIIVGSLELFGKVTPFNANQFFALFLVAAIFFPLQGMMMFIIFIRPSYQRTRERLGHTTPPWRVFAEALVYRSTNE